MCILAICVTGTGKWERLGSVKWPGFEEEEGKEESAEIQTYSDSDSDLQEEVKGKNPVIGSNLISYPPPQPLGG